MSTPPKTSIGNVAVHKGMPPGNNPYRGCGYSYWNKDDPITSVDGDERVAALRTFRDTGDTGEYTFWHAPFSGGARQITSKDQINWSQMRKQ